MKIRWFCIFSHFILRISLFSAVASRTTRRGFQHPVHIEQILQKINI